MSETAQIIPWVSDPYQSAIMGNVLKQNGMPYDTIIATARLDRAPFIVRVVWFRQGHGVFTLWQAFAQARLVSTPVGYAEYDVVPPPDVLPTDAERDGAASLAVSFALNAARDETRRILGHLGVPGCIESYL